VLLLQTCQFLLRHNYTVQHLRVDIHGCARCCPSMSSQTRQRLAILYLAQALNLGHASTSQYLYYVFLPGRQSELQSRDS